LYPMMCMKQCHRQVSNYNFLVLKCRIIIVLSRHVCHLHACFCRLLGNLSRGLSKDANLRTMRWCITASQISPCLSVFARHRLWSGGAADCVYSIYAMADSHAKWWNAIEARTDAKVMGDLRRNCYLHIGRSQAVGRSSRRTVRWTNHKWQSDAIFSQEHRTIIADTFNGCQSTNYSSQLRLGMHKVFESQQHSWN